MTATAIKLSFPAMPTDPPATGLYADMPEPIYRRSAAVSQSLLKRMGTWMQQGQALVPGPWASPAHALAALNDPEDQTDAQKLGTDYHTLLLEPTAFKREYFALTETIDRRTAAGKAEWARLSARYGDDRVLTRERWELLQKMAAAAAAHPLAKSVIGARGRREVSLFWTDAETRLPVKARLDFLIEADAKQNRPPYIIDLKTTRCSHPVMFEKDAAKYGYHVQAALYLDSLRAVTGQDGEYYILAQETDAPYPAVLYRVPEESIDAGRVVYREALRVFARCHESGRWPAYPESVIPLHLPTWAQAVDERDDWSQGHE